MFNRIKPVIYTRRGSILSAKNKINDLRATESYIFRDNDEIVTLDNIEHRYNPLKPHFFYL